MSAVATPVQPATDLKLQIHRTYKATPQAIFEAWINPEFIQQWFDCGHNVFTGATTDPRPGGAYRIDGGTELLLTHELFHTEQSRDSHNTGWISCLDGMDRLFALL